jgi:hypothetical protein
MMEKSARVAYFIHRVGHCMKDVVKILFILRFSSAMVGAALNFEAFASILM